MAPSQRILCIIVTMTTVLCANIFPVTKENCGTLKSYISRMLMCVERDKVAAYNDYKCYNLGLNSGSCDGESEILVIDPACHLPEARCIQSKLSNGTVCTRNQPLVYQDQCQSLGWICGGQMRRLEYDIFGQVNIK